MSPEIVEIASLIVIVVVVAGALPVAAIGLNRFLAAKWSDQRLMTLQRLVYEAVHAAEQKFDKMEAAEKKAFVMAQVEEFADMLNLKLSEAQLSMLVEAALGVAKRVFDE